MALLFCFCVPGFRWIANEGQRENLVTLHKKVADLNEGTLQRFVLRARKAVGLRGTVNVLVTSSAAIRSLNRQFRNHNEATDVLSFPSNSSTPEFRRRPKPAGDIAISADIARQNSIRLGHPVSREIKILALHGILHLAGFDHERDNGEMARKEANLRRALRLPVALIERVHPAHSSSQPQRGVARTPTAARTA